MYKGAEYQAIKDRPDTVQKESVCGKHLIDAPDSLCKFRKLRLKNKHLLNLLTRISIITCRQSYIQEFKVNIRL